jgi:folate-binding protein YgfZ
MADQSGVWVSVSREVVTVAGADARSYLHGQVSQDIQSLQVGDSRWTLVLAPNGRVDVLARVLCTAADRFELDTEVGYGDVLATRLNRFRIRVKAEIEQSTVDLFAPLDDIGEPSQQKSDGSAHQYRVGWWGRGLWADALPPKASLGTADDYERARVAAGWPAMGSEIVPGERIPAEIAVGSVTVDFKKGCYPGQELVERMDSRGSEAPRQLRLVAVEDGQYEDVEVTSVAGDRALAYVKRGVAVGEAPGPTSC